MSWVLAAALLQEARDVLLSDRPIEVRVPVAGDDRHPAAVVTFPEDSLDALVAGWADGDLSIERRRENLFLKLLRKAEGDLHVLGGSGRLYRLSIRPAEGAYDGRVRLVLPLSKGRIPEPIELIRAMRLGRRPPAGTVLRAGDTVYAGPDLRASAVYVYDGQAFRGFVLKAENVSGRPLRVDPSRFVGKDLVLAGTREMVLGPGATTLVYLVVSKAP